MRTLITVASVALFVSFAGAAPASAQTTPGNQASPAPVLAGGLISSDYSTFNPSVGLGGGQAAFSGAYLFPIGGQFGVNLNAGYDGVSSGGIGNRTTFFNGALDYQRRGHGLPFSFRGGVDVGFQSNVTIGSYMNTYDYGGYFDDDFCDDDDGYVFGGGFTTYNNTTSWTGTYVGGGLNSYVAHNWAFRGQINQAWFNTVPVHTSETDYSLTIKYQVSKDFPLVAYGGYTFSTFAPGTLSVNTFTGGLRFYLGGGPSKTLDQHERTGPIETGNFLLPLQYRF